MPAWARRWLIYGEAPDRDTAEAEHRAFINARYLYSLRPEGVEWLRRWWTTHRKELLAEAEAAGVYAYGRFYDWPGTGKDQQARFQE